MGADVDDTDDDASGSARQRGRGSEKNCRPIHYNQPYLMTGEKEHPLLLADALTNIEDNDNAVKTDGKG